MNDDRLAAIHAEIQRQDAQFDAFEKTLKELGDAMLAVPTEILEDLDATATPFNPVTPVVGVRA